MADFAEADQRQLLALEVIDVPQEGSKHVGPQVANLPWAARWIFGLYRPRDRRCDFFQRSRDHRRIAKQSQTVFKCPGINSFSRLQRCWLDFPAAPVNSVEAEDTARTFSRHCGYNRKQAGSLRHLCGYFRRLAADRPTCCRFEVLCSFAERASTGGSSQARGTTSSMLRRRPRAAAWRRMKHAQRALEPVPGSVFCNYCDDRLRTAFTTKHFWSVEGDNPSQRQERPQVARSR